MDWDIIYFKALTEGAILGIGLAFLIGPAFFALLTASIEHGFRVSAALAAGVVVSDGLLMLICYQLILQLNKLSWFGMAMGLGGGIVLLFTGLQIIKTRNQKTAKIQFSYKAFWQLFAKGFTINTINPFPWTFWLSTSEMVSHRFGSFGPILPFTFFLTAAITVFSTDLAKAGFAQLILKHLTPQVLSTIKLISGICLLGFAAYLIGFALKYV